MAILSAQGLFKAYPGFELRDISFAVEPGSIMGFIGRNGAGKTTTLKSLLGFVHPDAGETRFFGLPFGGNEQAIKSRIGFVSGGVDFYPQKKLKTITAVTRRFYASWDQEAYGRYMARFRLDENKTPKELSAGMKVKYALVLALSHRAELLLLDEPTSGLDPVSREGLLDIFLALRDEGVSTLFSTHITSDLEKCADHIAYIQNGSMVFSGEQDAFLAQYRLLSLTDEQALDPAIAPLLAGVRRARKGYTALVRTQSVPVGLPSEPASLNTIMTHLEKEDAE